MWAVSVGNHQAGARVWECEGSWSPPIIPSSSSFLLSEGPLILLSLVRYAETRANPQTCRFPLPFLLSPTLWSETAGWPVRLLHSSSRHTEAEPRLLSLSLTYVKWISPCKQKVHYKYFLHTYIFWSWGSFLGPASPPLFPRPHQDTHMLVWDYSDFKCFTVLKKICSFFLLDMS